MQESTGLAPWWYQSISGEILTHLKNIFLAQKLTELEYFNKSLKFLTVNLSRTVKKWFKQFTAIIGIVNHKKWLLEANFWIFHIWDLSVTSLCSRAQYAPSLNTCIHWFKTSWLKSPYAPEPSVPPQHCLWPNFFIPESFSLLKRPAWSHSFNAKISFEKYAQSPQLLRKNCPKLAFQTKPSKFDTFLPISWD